MRKVLVVLLILGAAFGAWWYFKVRNSGKTIPQVVSEISFPLVGSITSRMGGDGTGFNNSTGTSGENTDETTNIPTVKQKLEQLVPTPVAGFTVFNVQKSLAATMAEDTKNQSTTPVGGGFSSNNFVRYVDRANGYVYEIANNGTSIQITNVYIPNIYEAFFADNGKKAILRFLRDDQKTIATFVVPIPEANLDGSRTQLQGSFFPDNIRSLAVSPDTNLIAQLAPNNTGGTVLTISDSANKNRKDIMNNSFRDWLISWTAQDRVSVQTRAAGTVEGYFYTIAQSDVRLRKILSAMQGLTASMSPQGGYVLYSESTPNNFLTKLYTVGTGRSITLAVQVLPDKCVWTLDEELICAAIQNASDAIYPDSWYAGLVKFSDTIVRISPSSGLLTTLYDEGVDFDATNLQFDEVNNQLYFINKNDATLWRLNI